MNAHAAPWALLLAGCAAAPSARLTWRETWELVAATDDGLLIEASVSQANTGLLRGQADLQVTIFPPRESAVVLHRTVPPQLVRFEPDRGELRLDQDHLDRSNGTWTLDIREGREALDATLHLAPGLPELPPTTLVEGARQWQLGAPVPLGEITGAWRAGEQGGLLRGEGMLVRQSSDTWPGVRPPRTEVYLFGMHHTLAVRTVGDAALCWLTGGDEVRVGHRAALRWESPRLGVDLAPDLPVSATIRLSPHTVQTEPWEHLLPFERLIARATVGWPLRTWERGNAQLTVDGVEEPATALIVHGEAPHGVGR
ncbi:MAG: hypothetical protein ABIO70_09265 [Pseudomonadota bacterium]